jgi:hypothetical protein
MNIDCETCFLAFLIGFALYLLVNRVFMVEGVTDGVVGCTVDNCDDTLGCTGNEKCFCDNKCPGLGCGALGVKNCRFCGFGGFPPCGGSTPPSPPTPPPPLPTPCSTFITKSSCVRPRCEWNSTQQCQYPSITIPIEGGGGYPRLKLYFHGSDDVGDDNTDDNLSEVMFRLDTGCMECIHGDYNSLNKDEYRDMGIIGAGWSIYCRLVEGPVYMKDDSGNIIKSIIQFYSYDSSLGVGGGPPGGRNICGPVGWPHRTPDEQKLLANIEGYPYSEFNFNRDSGNIILYSNLPDEALSYKNDTITGPGTKIKVEQIRKDDKEKSNSIHIENGIILNMDTGSELIAYTGAVDHNNLPNWVPNRAPDFQNFIFNKEQIIQIVTELCEGIEEDSISRALKTWMEGLNNNDKINWDFVPPRCPSTIGHYGGCWVFKIHVINSDLYKSVKYLIGDENINYIPLSNSHHYRTLTADIDSIQFLNNQRSEIDFQHAQLFIQANGSKNEINTGMIIYYSNRVIWDTTNPDVIYIIPK